jgi:predicted secreted protein
MSCLIVPEEHLLIRRTTLAAQVATGHAYLLSSSCFHISLLANSMLPYNFVMTIEVNVLRRLPLISTQHVNNTTVVRLLNLHYYELMLEIYLERATIPHKIPKMSEK